MKNSRRGASRRREYTESQIAQEYEKGQEPQIQAEGDGVIASNHHHIIFLSENVTAIIMSVGFIEYQSKEVQRQSEGGGVITPNHNDIIYLSANTSYITI